MRRPLLMEDGHGLMFEYLDSDEAEYLYEEIFTRRSYVRHGISVPLCGCPVVFDVGANIGLFSLFVLRENPRATVVAIEPSPEAFGVLERNLGHATSSATCLPFLARDRPGSQRLVCFADTPAEATCNPRERRMQRVRLQTHRGPRGAESEAASTERAVQVEAQTVSQMICSTLGQDVSIDLLKIDVEGDEVLVLLGIAADHWRQIRQVVVEVHDIYGRLDRICHLLRRRGFRVRVEPQRGGTVDNYEMVVPEELRLWYVYGCRGISASKRRLHQATKGGRSASGSTSS